MPFHSSKRRKILMTINEYNCRVRFAWRGGGNLSGCSQNMSSSIYEQSKYKEKSLLCGSTQAALLRLVVENKNVTGSANFPPAFLFLSGLCFAFFKHTQMIYAGYHGKNRTGELAGKN